MYVKVTAGRDPQSPGQHHGDFLAEVVPPLYSDHVAAPLGRNAERSEKGAILTVGDVDFPGAIGAEFAVLHVLEIDPQNTVVQEDGSELFSFRYAWWDDPGVGRTAVITTRNIFVLGANGKTIDRV